MTSTGPPSTVSTDAAVACPSGFVTVTVFLPAMPLTVETFTRTDVASRRVTLLTVMPGIDTAIRQEKPAGESKKPCDPDGDAVRTMSIDGSPTRTVAGDALTRAGGASRCTLM